MAAAPQPANAPVFISYSRRDYYFAESLALHLLKERVPAWLDVKDLTPGVFWERDLFASLDAASCIVVVASKESMASPNVRQEIERARSQKKRIIVARFRGVTLPDSLRDCDQVDFRGSFRGGLRELTKILQAPLAPNVSRRKLLRVPAWVLAIAIFLAIPTITFIALADWSDPSKIADFAIVVAVALAVAWAAILSFLQRKMGMTRLAIFLVVLSAIFAMPILLYQRNGQAGLQGYATNIANAISEHTGAMSLLASVPLLGLALIVVARPYDLLRWTPTGRAWQWYRRKCAAQLTEAREPRPAGAGELFFLLHDPADQRAAEQVRSELARAGWQESETHDNPSAKAVLLLTNRTGSDWLLAQQPRLGGDVLTIVATSISLPSQLDWLWKREWIDFRGWDLTLPHQAEALPQVPEAVTQPRFPAAVRFANHLLCALTGLAFILMAMANPQAMSDSQQPPPVQMVGLVAGGAVVVIGIEVSRRLLRRSITDQKFYRGAWIVWFGALILAGGAWMQGIAAPAWLRVIPVVIFLAPFPFALLRTRARLAFWFPTFPLRPKDQLRTLAGKRIWRTFWCLSAYMLLWAWILGAFKD